MLNSNLNQAIISEMLAHTRNGELNYLIKQLGFSEEEIAEVESLSTQEIFDICDGRASFATIQINHQAFWNLVAAAREKTRQRNVIDRALVLGASSDILHKRFGQSSADVSARRKLLGINEPMGRKRNATEEEETRVWELWAAEKHNFTDVDVEYDEKALDVMMFIAEQTSVCLTEVSRLIVQWTNNRG